MMSKYLYQKLFISILIQEQSWQVDELSKGEFNLELIWISRKRASFQEKQNPGAAIWRL